MLYYDRIGVSEGIDAKRARKSAIFVTICIF